MSAPLDVSARFDPATFRQFMGRVKEFSPHLATALRRRLRLAGEATVEDMKAEILNGPGPRSGGIRTAIASGIKTTVATGQAHQGVRIQASSAKLSPKHRAMLRLYNKKSFRHPVFGRSPWVTEGGRPYFGSTIHRHEDEMRKAIVAALDDALREMSR